MTPQAAFRNAGTRPQPRRTDVQLRAERLGGTEGNELLTAATALVLVVLLAVEGVTILRLGSLRSEHMFVGLVLIGPVLLKLGSTGYRFVRYYGGASPYREKGPPLLPLRLLAPVLVVATVAVFASGVALLLIGHRSDTLVLIHKAGFIVWGACFAIHFLAYLPRSWHALGAGRAATSSGRVPGSRLRAMLVAISIGGGLAVGLALLSSIEGWRSF